MSGPGVGHRANLSKTEGCYPPPTSFLPCNKCRFSLTFKTSLLSFAGIKKSLQSTNLNWPVKTETAHKANDSYWQLVGQ